MRHYYMRHYYVHQHYQHHDHKISLAAVSSQVGENFASGDQKLYMADKVQVRGSP